MNPLFSPASKGVAKDDAKTLNLVHAFRISI